MFEDFIPLNPANFFAVNFDCHYFSGKEGEALPKKYLLPNLSFFYDKAPYAAIYLGWSEKGIFATVTVEEPLKGSFFPEYRQGDSIEFFIDTRDVKTAAYVTRFCHHFCFLPQIPEKSEEQPQGVEITRFRGEESHPLADPETLFVKGAKQRKGYSCQLFIPKASLFGYDPTQFDRLGFSYRINSATVESQYFSASGEEVAIEKAPSTWASLKLVKG